MKESSTIHMDGSLLEGGGQLLRDAILYSSLFGQRVAVDNIRASRKNPGLRPQHLAGLRLMRDLYNAYISGDELDSTSIVFGPSSRLVISGSLKVDTRTAGSITLLLQQSLPGLLMSTSPFTIDFHGGTDVPMAPSIDYLMNVFLHMLQKELGQLCIQFLPLKRGFYPRGGGHVQVTGQPLSFRFRPINLTARGNSIVTVKGTAFGKSKYLNEDAAQCLLEASQTVLLKHLPITPEQIDIRCLNEKHCSFSSEDFGITLWLETDYGYRLGSSKIVAKGKNAECVGIEVAEALVKSWLSGECVDEYLQDQLIVYMALADGISEIVTGPITLHTKTAIFVAEKMTKSKFVIQQIDRVLFNIKCFGAGFGV